MDQARLAQEYANLASVYDPQRALVQQQIAALPAQYEGQKSALEQAKVNAFRDIGTAAQARGTFFSGFRPQEMARYTGEKYLPALANLSTQQQQATFNLQKALADVELAQRQAATTNLQNILNREQQQQRQFEQSLAAYRAAGGGGGGGGYADGPTLDLSGLMAAMKGKGGGQPAQQQQQYIGQNDYRGRLSFEAKQGDKDAAVLLKYVGNDGKAGGVIASQSDYNILKKHKIGGNYKLATPKGAAASYQLPSARQIVIPTIDFF